MVSSIKEKKVQKEALIKKQKHFFSPKILNSIFGILAYIFWDFGW